jgi:primosomal protein N' (replication factor Y) (superfamily II helicase)
MQASPAYLQVVFNLPLEGPFTYRQPEPDPKRPQTSAMVRPGMRVEAPFRGRLRIGYVVDTAEERPAGDFKILPVKRTLDVEVLFDEKQLELAQWISRMYFCSLGEALSVIIPGGKRESNTEFLPTEEDSFRVPAELSEAQSSALERISKGEERMHYLYGVTGSGKTEVFLRLAKQTIAAGGAVVYLVPEIALTHQLIQQVQARFGSTAAVWHSKLTPSQKLKEWRRMLAAEVRFVIGARSAVFSPMENIGLFVVDEEHETSYKSGQTPRYHARQVAMKRCALSGAKLVMGSATPSLEAYELMNRGQIVRHDLPDRVSGGQMPVIETVSMQGQGRAISDRLTDEINKTAAMGKQTILFLNRRGFSYFFHCRSCGYEMQCSHCSVNLTYHKATNRMVCHYCGYSRRPVEVCPECGSLDVGYSGFGTEKIEEDIRQLFPQLKIARVDTDSTRKKGSLQKILKDFRAGDYDLLLGTQMVAKGLNFPGVRLVGIVLADSALNLPDFRAGERTFNLIVQVSGRAGRFLEEGKVLVQTYKPHVPAIRLAVENNLPRFYEDELTARKQLLFPPYYRLFRIVVRGRERNRVSEVIEGIETQLSPVEQVDKSTELLGPSPCPIEVIAGNSREQLLIRTQNFSIVHSFIYQWHRRFERPKGVHIEIDVDPVSLL